MNCIIEVIKANRGKYEHKINNELLVEVALSYKYYGKDSKYGEVSDLQILVERKSILVENYIREHGLSDTMKINSEEYNEFMSWMRQKLSMTYLEAIEEMKETHDEYFMSNMRDLAQFYAEMLKIHVDFGTDYMILGEDWE